MLCVIFLSTLFLGFGYASFSAVLPIYGTEDAVGTEIMVYKQVVTRGSDGVWIKDGTYIGRATVGYFFGGGKNGKDALTVNAYSWKAGIATIEETN